MSKFVPWNGQPLERTVHKLSGLTVSAVLAMILLLAACSVTNGGTTQQETEEPLQLSETPLSDGSEVVLMIDILEEEIPTLLCGGRRSLVLYVESTCLLK